MRLGRLAAVLLALAMAATLTTAARAADDPRWVFYAKDKHSYTSPWFDGAHRIMIPFGCTVAPYYSPDPRCRGDRGFHHGIDIAMPCGTRLFAATRFRVMSNDSLGSAYGENPVLLRNRRQGWDLVIGHTRKVYVEVRPGREGHRLRPGQRQRGARRLPPALRAARGRRRTLDRGRTPPAAPARPSGGGLTVGERVLENDV